MNSIYRPKQSGPISGHPNTMPENLKLSQTNLPLTSCSGCTSLYETMKYRSDFDKTFVASYQERLAMFDTNPMNLSFGK